MKLTDFTEEQIEGGSVRRKAWDPSISIFLGEGRALFLSYDGARGGGKCIPLNMLNIIADDWEIVKKKVEITVTYYVLHRAFDNAILLINDLNKRYVEASNYRCIDTITKTYEVDEV